MLAVVKGGLMELWDVPVSLAGQIRSDLTFKKWEYQTRRFTYIAAYEEVCVGRHRVFLVPRYYLNVHKAVGRYASDVYMDSVLGGELPEYQLCGKNLFWKGVDQEKVISQAVDHAQARAGGGYIVAPCGAGKTLMGLELIRRLGRRALIILNRRYQISQWRAEFASFDCPKNTYGIYQGKRRNRDNPIILATINTLLKERDPKFFESFGTAVFDEAHHIPAHTWLEMLSRLRSRYIFAMTAGFHRTDQLDSMFAMFGEVVAAADVQHAEGGTADMLHLMPWLLTRLPNYGRPLNRMQIASALKKNDARTQTIAGIILRIKDTSRNILVFSDIREHLDRLHAACIAQGMKRDDAGFFVGGMSASALEAGGACPVTFVTYEMGKESMNLPWKDTAICCTPPPSNLKQLKGRIDRVYPTKMFAPYIVDFIDPGRHFIRKARRRVRGWEEEGLKVRQFQYKGGERHATASGE